MTGPDDTSDTTATPVTPAPAGPPVPPPVTPGWVTATPAPAEPVAPPAPAAPAEPVAPPAPAEPAAPVEPPAPEPVAVDAARTPEPDPIADPEVTQDATPDVADASPAPEASAPEAAPANELDDPAPEQVPVTDAGSADDEGAAAGVRRGVSFGLLTALAALAALAVLAVAVLGALTLARDTPAERRDTAREEALRTARDAARLLLAYDYRRLEQDFAAGAALTADPFKSEYAKTTSRLVTEVAKKYNAVVRSEVVQAGAVEVSDDRVVALLFVNQTTTSTRVEGAKVDLSRVRMVLERRGDDWKVVDVDAL